MSELDNDRLSEWWLPQSPERRVTGRVYVSPDTGILIETAGDLESDWAPFESPGPITPEMLSRRFPVILGKLSNGTKVTLARCLQSSMSLPGIGSGPRYSTYMAEVAFVGQHFATEEEATFTKLILVYPQLVDWVGSALKKLEPPHADQDRTKTVVEYDHGVIAKLTVDDLRAYP